MDLPPGIEFLPRQLKQLPTVLVLKATSWYFSPVVGSRDFLSALLSHYRVGLTKPLVFFPQSSFEYAEKILMKGKSRDDAVAAAMTKWEGYRDGYGENQDPYFQLCFSKTKPEDIFGTSEFHENAITIYGPLLEHIDTLDEDFYK